MEKERLLYLLEQEKTGLSSAEEVKELQDWYESGQERADFTGSLSEPALLAMEGKIFSKIQKRTYGEIPALHYPPVRHLFSEFYRIAVSVMVLFFAGTGIYYFYHKSTIHEETTAYGETRKIILPDGSEVTLNGNSEMTYAADWKNGVLREVNLTGEAYFKVVHTADNRKFRVRTDDDFSLDVLGTQFNVANRQSGTRVVLNEGRVQCNLSDKAADTLILKPGEMVQFNKKPSEYVRKKVEASVYSAWKDHKLVFQNTSLKEISEILKDTYGLKTETNDPELLSRKISGSVPTDNIKLLLEGIASASEVKIHQEGNTLILTAP